ncbi:MAG: hypothetical protein IJ543_08400 [Bacteroidales bacterium]|nr:hypothetical protein [Bacteroidales bacterium]
MKTKNIFKTLILAAVLVSACSKNDIVDDFKGYTLPVTINVTRQGDEPATRATYNESTKKLEFSAGDKLFVEANYSSAGQFAGLLDYDAGSGKFSGTIYTESQYTGTVEALLADASALMATLLPAGYDTKGYLSISNAGAYNADLSVARNKVFALTKKEAVEQLSFESVDEYSSGFALAPQNGVVCFSISGLAANTEVDVIFKEKADDSVPPVKVTTDASGVATFAAGMPRYANFDWYSLTVDGNAIALPADKEVVAGKIYNMSRSLPVIWNSSKVAGININEDPEENSFESDGITVAAFGDSGANFTGSKMSVGGWDGYFTFTSSVGNIKKIEINYTGDVYGYEEETPVGWSLGVGTFTWEGDPATSVTLSSSGYASIEGITSIVFTLQ